MNLLFQVGIVGQVGAIAVAVDDADEAQGIVVVGVKLMQRFRRNVYDIVQAKRLYFVAQNYGSGPPYDDHGMRVPVIFQGRESAGLYFEIARLKIQVMFILTLTQQGIAVHIFKVISVGFVISPFHRFPRIIIAFEYFGSIFHKDCEIDN